MNDENARASIAMVRRASAALDASLIVVEETDTREAFDPYRRAIGHVLGAVYGELIEPAVRRRPELWAALEARGEGPPDPLPEEPVGANLARILAHAEAAPGRPMHVPGAAAAAGCRGKTESDTAVFRRRVARAVTRLEADRIAPMSAAISDDDRP